MNQDTLCFLAILAGVLVLGFAWIICLDLDRIADSLERLSGKEREQ